jgi:hypothetical protein
MTTKNNSAVLEVARASFCKFRAYIATIHVFEEMLSKSECNKFAIKHV